jgi:lipopolysaccharide export system protein LptA
MAVSAYAQDAVSASDKIMPPPGKSDQQPELKTPTSADTLKKGVGDAAKKSASDKISMESDKAVINRADRVIELDGNVKISQGDTVVTSNTLKIFLKEGASVDTPAKSGENSIEKLIADGNVEFKLDTGTAYADHAEYKADTRLLILTGKAPRFVSGENTITGSKITVNRDTGMVSFEGGDSRVEAVIYSKEKL